VTLHLFLSIAIVAAAQRFRPAFDRVATALSAEPRRTSQSPRSAKSRTRQFLPEWSSFGYPVVSSGRRRNYAKPALGRKTSREAGFVKFRTISP
jgi:hypothetical protein